MSRRTHWNCEGVIYSFLKKKLSDLDINVLRLTLEFRDQSNSFLVRRNENGLFTGFCIEKITQFIIETQLLFELENILKGEINE